MAGWYRNVVSKMQWEIQRRRQQTYSGRHDAEEESVSEMQTRLSDIGSIRELQAHRAASAIPDARTTETQTETRTPEAQTTAYETEDEEGYTGG